MERAEAAAALSVRRKRHQLSSELTFQLEKGANGFGFQVRPFDIECATADGPGAVLGGMFTIFEIAAIDDGGAAAAAGVQLLDILLVVGGVSVRGVTPQQLVQCLQTAQGGQPWRVMRVHVPEGEVDTAERMRLTLRAYQECAATFVQSRWRTRKARREFRAQHQAQEKKQQVDSEDAADREQRKAARAAASSKALQQLSSRISELDAGFGELADEGTPPERRKKSPSGKHKKKPRRTSNRRRAERSPRANASETPLQRKSDSTRPDQPHSDHAAHTVSALTPRRDAERAKRRLLVQQRCARVAQQTIQMSPRAQVDHPEAATSSVETQSLQPHTAELANPYHMASDGLAGDLVTQVRMLRGVQPLEHHDVDVAHGHAEGDPLNSSTVPPASPRGPSQMPSSAWGSSPEQTELSPSATSRKGRDTRARVVPMVPPKAGFLRPTRSAQGRMEEQTAAARAVATKQKEAHRRKLAAAGRGAGRHSSKVRHAEIAQQSAHAPLAAERVRRLRSPARQKEHVSRLSEPKNVRTRSPRADPAGTKGFVFANGSQTLQSTPLSKNRRSPFSSLADEQQEQKTTPGGSLRQLSAQRQAMQIVAKERDSNAVRPLITYRQPDHATHFAVSNHLGVLQAQLSQYLKECSDTERRQIIHRLRTVTAEIEESSNGGGAELDQPRQDKTTVSEGKPNGSKTSSEHQLPQERFGQQRAQTRQEQERTETSRSPERSRSRRLTSPDPSPRLLSPTKASASRAEAVAEHLAFIGMGIEWIDTSPGVGHYAPTHQTDLSEATRPKRGQQSSFGKSQSIEIDSSGHYIVTGKNRPTSPQQEPSFPQPHSLVRKKSDIAEHISKLHSWHQQTKSKKEEATESHHASFAAAHQKKLDSSFKVRLGISNEGDQSATKQRSQAAAMKTLAQPVDETRGQEVAEQQIDSLPFSPQLNDSFAAKGAGQSLPDDNQGDEATGRKACRGGQAALSERLSSPRRVSAMAHDNWAPDQVTRRVCIHVSPSDPVGTMCRFCQPSAISDHHTLYSDEHNITKRHAGHLNWSTEDDDGHVSEILQRTRSFSTKGAGEQHVVDLHGHETESRKQRPQRSREELQAFNARELSEKELKSLLQRVRGGKLPKCAATSDLRAKQAKEVSAIKATGEDYLATRLHSTHQTMLEKLESARAAIKKREESSTTFVPNMSPGSRRMMSPRKENSPLSDSRDAKASDDSSITDVAAVARELEVGLAGELDELEALEAAELANMEMAAAQEADTQSTDAVATQNELGSASTTATAVATSSSMITVTCPEGCQPGSAITVEVDGLEIEVEIPDGVVPGGVFDVEFDERSDEEDDTTPTARDSTGVDSTVESAQHDAALVVQRQWRGYRVRARPASSKPSSNRSEQNEVFDQARETAEQDAASVTGDDSDDGMQLLSNPRNATLGLPATARKPTTVAERRASLVVASNMIDGLEAMYNQLKDDLATPGVDATEMSQGETEVNMQHPAGQAKASAEQGDPVFSQLAGILDADTDSQSSTASDDSSLDLQSLGVIDTS